MDDRHYPDRPFVGVGAVIWKGDEVLLVQRGKEPGAGQWSIPGGAQHLGETVFEAAHREVREETALEIEILGLVDVVDLIRRDDDARVRLHYTLVDVVAEWRKGTAIAGDDASALAWVPPYDLERFELWAETVRVIHAASDLRQRLGHTQ